jgi:hypothetical protein
MSNSLDPGEFGELALLHVALVVMAVVVVFMILIVIVRGGLRVVGGGRRGQVGKIHGHRLELNPVPVFIRTLFRPLRVPLPAVVQYERDARVQDDEHQDHRAEPTREEIIFEKSRGKPQKTNRNRNPNTKHHFRTKQPQQSSQSGCGCGCGCGWEARSHVTNYVEDGFA